jgi:DNA-binding NtrC family response regulator
VLIEGETGTGKELVARAIHYNSARAERAFIPVNCGAIPENLVENELFGHERGAFTDARCSQTGLIAQAEGGTLFLDEVETLPAKAQVALLRFLEDRQYKRLGSAAPLQADVRVVAASNASLAGLCEAGRCRSDFYFRLNILSITLPPLRERVGDIELLAGHFLGRYTAEYGLPSKHLHPDTLAWMRTYHWPGNVRELEHLIHRAVLMAEGACIRLESYSDRDVGPQSQSDRCVSPPVPQQDPMALTRMSFQQAKTQASEEFERRYLTQLMTEVHGNVTLAARRAGKERRALGKLLKKHGLGREQYL